MHRRTLLSLVGTAATAGCLGAIADGPDPDESGQNPTEPPRRVTTGAGYVIDVGSIDVQVSVLVMGVHADVRAMAGSAYLRVPVTLTDRDGRVITDLEPYDRLRDGLVVRLRGGTSTHAAFDRSHEGPGMVLAVAVPVGDYDDGEVRIDLGGGNAIHVPAPVEALSALADPPAFEVHDLSIESPIERQTLEATITVENGGGTDGRFLAELGPVTVSDTPEIGFDVPAGETVSNEVSVTVVAPRGSEEATIRLEWGVDQLEQTVEVAGE